MRLLGTKKESGKKKGGASLLLPKVTLFASFYPRAAIIPARSHMIGKQLQ